MARSNYERCFAFTLRYEGGYVNHPRDPGGATNLGITKRVLEGHRGRPVSIAEVKALTKDEAGEIYRKNYWRAVRGDDLPSGVDLVVWDYGVNSGPSRAIKAMQRALKVRVDGHVGAATIAAANEADPVQLVEAICKERQRFVRSLKTYSTFGKGWERRIAAVRSLGLKMTQPKSDPEPDMPEETQPKANPEDKALGSSTTIGAGTIAGAGGAIAAGKEVVDVAQDATRTASDGWEIAASIGPWVLLAVVIAAAAGYIIYERRRKARETGE
jgi:lysozyme family protein